MSATSSRITFLFACVMVFSFAEARAETIIKVGLGNTGPDVSLTSGVFGTVPDGGGAPGDQITDIDFVGFFSFIPDVLDGASFSLDNVILSGVADVGPGVVSQETAGGTFSLYGTDGSLLLGGALDGGVIVGSTGVSTGSFFNTNIAVFSAGSLLPYLIAESAGLSLALTSISGVQGATGLSYSCGDDDKCSLDWFSADATGLIEGTSVPEPLSAALVLSGLISGAAIRRKRRAA